jgi:hypothetical protein
MSDPTNTTKAVIARFVEHWCRTTQHDQTRRSWQWQHTPYQQSRYRAAGQPSTRGAVPSEAPEMIGPGRLDAAARWAPMAFPGPIGELISREIHAYLNFGLRFTGGGFIAAVGEQVLNAPAATRPVTSRMQHISKEQS